MSAEDAGIGDPFWYEWTVGQLHVVDMLDPDSHIGSVTFQKSGIKGLDDVVVAYADGRPDVAIQVKHTRVGDTLTFGDLVTPGAQGTSLLAHLASSWRDITVTGKKYRAVLYTNRTAGVTKASVSSDGQRFERPALAEFWEWLGPRLRTVIRLTDLAVPSEWSQAWDEWTSALAVLESESAKLEFLKSLEINADQPELDDLHSRVVANLAKRFGVTEAQGRTLAQALDAGLRRWATSYRRSESITAEDVMDALCLPAAGPPRDHALAPPAPFFSSRDAFVEDLTNTLKSRAAPIVFLSGPPGCGKTSIVSVLANRHDPVVLLRFHAFRPITPGDTLLPEDAGRATTARALWGDLLSQLRTLLRGRLARFAVPVRNEFLSEAQLRDHVLRLATAWASETGATAVLAIDGLDHAARSQDPHHLSLLKSLPSPEAVPASVALLVAGQPSAGNPEYPVWLKGPHPGVLVRAVPDIAQADIAAALAAQGTTIPAEDREAAHRVIARFAGGNTLAAMFGIYEAGSCVSAQALDERLQARRLSDGLSAYYDAIWAKAVQGAESLVPLVGTHVAAVLALTATPVSGTLLRNVFPSIALGGEQWHELLSRLTPLVVGSDEGFRLHHNDVRVHLMRQLQNQQQVLLRAASGLASSYIADPALVVQKHADAVRLLVLSREWNTLAQLLSPAFVLEGWVHGRSSEEIGDDLAHGFRGAPYTKDWDLLHQLCCAALTLRQLRNSAAMLSFAENNGPGPLSVPPLLPSEARVVPRAEWTPELVHDVARDAWTLVRSSQHDRARDLLRRWFIDLSPSEVARSVSQEDRQTTQSELTPALELWGRACANVGRAWHISESGGGARDHAAEEAFLSGELDEAIRLGGVHRIGAALQSGSAFDADRVAAAVDVLLAAGRWRELVPFLNKMGPGVPSPLRLRLALAALLTCRHDAAQRFTQSLRSDRFRALDDVSGSMDIVAHHAWLCVLLGWLERSSHEPHSIRDEALGALFSQRAPDNRDRAMVGVLFGAGAMLGRALGALVDRGSSFAAAYLPRGALGSLVQQILLSFSASRVHLPLGAHPAAVALVQIASGLSRKMGREHTSEVSRVLAQHVVAHPLGPFEETAWQHLSAEAPQSLGPWISAVLGERGVAWDLPGTERFDVAQRFSSRARGMEFEQICTDALKKIRWGVISYASHKDYSLDIPLQWFTRLAGLAPSCWGAEGVRLLAISRDADVAGDNRMDSEVTAAVFDSACAEGPSAVDRLLRLSDEGESDDWLQATGTSVVPEAYSRLAEAGARPVDELRTMWCWSFGCLAWQEDGDRGALVRIRDNLCAAAKKSGAERFAAEMQELAPLEWALSISGERSDRGVRVETPTPPSTIEEAEHLFNQSPESSPRLLVPLVRAARDAPDQKAKIERILNILARCDQGYGWTYSGALAVLLEAMPLLTNDERWGLVQQWVNTREYDALELWLDQARDIDALCRARGDTEGVAALQAGTQRLLRMHELWRDGAGHLRSLVLPRVPTEPNANSWLELALDALLNSLELQGVLDVSAAARGLFGLCSTERGVASALATRAATAPERTRSVTLLVLERLAGSHPNYAVHALPFIQSAARSTEISTKLQAWVVLEQLRRSGEDLGGFEYEPVVSAGTPSVVVAPRRPLLTIEDRTEGRLSFGEPIQLVRLLFERVSAVTGEASDEIESAFSAFLPPDLPQESTRGRATRYWDVRLRDSPLMDAALDFLSERARSGRWAGTPEVTLAQAVLLGDDPWVLLRSGQPCPAMDGWLIDDDLDQAVGKVGNKHVLEKLRPLMRVGLRDDDVLVGGMLSTYSRNWDVELHHAHGPKRITVRENAPVGSTFGGRSFSWHDPARHQAGHPGWLTLHHGGLMQFPDETFAVVPSVTWTTGLRWRPDPRNPTRWYSSDGETIRFERFVGPHRSVVREPIERQPLLQRWVCGRETWERACAALRRPPVPHEHIRVERSPFATNTA